MEESKTCGPRAPGEHGRPDVVLAVVAKVAGADPHRRPGASGGSTAPPGRLQP